MKVFVQIPCLNEEKTLPLVLKSIPKKIKGVSSIEVLIIDDGSTDKTLEVAKKHGVKHFVYHKKNRGLARSFHDGVNYALEHGADIIINTDGDNQYPQADIPRLIQPIIDGHAEIVIADRQTQTIAHFSPLKKLLQRFGSWIVNQAAGTDIPDAVSGFRAYSREAAMELNVVTDFSYCTETIIQAGRKRIPMTSIQIETNEKTRESRLFKSMWHHIFNSMTTILRIYLMYKPLKIFLSSGIVMGIIGSLPFFRFLYLRLSYSEAFGAHVQSLIAGSVFIILGVLLIGLGLISELLAINRKLQEDSLYRLKKQHYDKSSLKKG